MGMGMGMGVGCVLVLVIVIRFSASPRHSQSRRGRSPPRRRPSRTANSERMPDVAALAPGGPGPIVGAGRPVKLKALKEWAMKKAKVKQNKTKQQTANRRTRPISTSLPQQRNRQDRTA